MENKQIGNKASMTSELNSLIEYMTNTLVVEFPTNKLGVEYLISAILDNPSCRAYKIIDRFVMSENIASLKQIYFNFLNTHAVRSSMPSYLSFNNEYDLIMTDAIAECADLGEHLTGSEHVLLAMINPSNPYGDILDVFSNIGITYDIVLGQCDKSKNKLNRKSGKQRKRDLFQMTDDNLTSSAKTNISQYTTSVNELVRKGKCDNLIGRENELNKIIETLSRRKKNNVIIVGNGGCGKTHIVYGLANLIEMNLVPDNLLHKEIISLNINEMLSGTTFRGAFEERVSNLIKELSASSKYILFIDNMESVLKNRQADKDTDISSVIETILSLNNVQVIGTITFKEYHKAIEPNQGLSRKLQKIVIEPTSIKDTISILDQTKLNYELFHNVRYSDDIINYSVTMASRYITDRCLPDSAFDVIDLCGAQTCFNPRGNEKVLQLRKELATHLFLKKKYLDAGDFENEESESNIVSDLQTQIAQIHTNYDTLNQSHIIEITKDDVNRAVSTITNIPISELSSDDKKRLANMESKLKESVIGQDDAIDKVCRIIKRHQVGLGDRTKTLGNVLLCGTSGCGKTLLAKQIAKCVFGSEQALIRIDMSEYSEKHSVSKLTGSAPGYIGYENGGQLTEAVKHKPHCVLLLDEIEKAHEEVYNLFLQLFDEGHLTDNGGEKVNFKNVIVLMTSNIGAKEAMENKGGFGFVGGQKDNTSLIVDNEIKRKFSPEFINRLDQIVYFNSLTEENFNSIIRLEINKVCDRLSQMDYSMVYDDSLVSYIFDKSWPKKEYGARPIIHAIQDELEDKITDYIINNDVVKNKKILIKVEYGKLQIKQ